MRLRRGSGHRQNRDRRFGAFSRRPAVDRCLGARDPPGRPRASDGGDQAAPGRPPGISRRVPPGTPGRHGPVLCGSRRAGVRWPMDRHTAGYHQRQASPRSAGAAGRHRAVFKRRHCVFGSAGRHPDLESGRGGALRLFGRRDIGPFGIGADLARPARGHGAEHGIGSGRHVPSIPRNRAPA